MQGIQFKTGIDANGFKTGLDAMKGHVTTFTKDLGNGFRQNVMSVFSGAFAANALTGGLSNFFGSLRERVAELRQVGAVSQQIGQSFQQTQALFNAAEEAGTGVEAVASGFTKLANALAQIQQGTGEADKLKNALNDLGITMGDIEGKGRQALGQAIFANLKAAAEQGRITEQQIRALLVLMGESATKMIPLIARGVQPGDFMPGADQGMASKVSRFTAGASRLWRGAADWTMSGMVDLYDWVSGGGPNESDMASPISKDQRDARRQERAGEAARNAAAAAEKRARAEDAALDEWQEFIGKEQEFIDKLKQEIYLLELRNAPVQKRVALLKEELALQQEKEAGAKFEADQLEARKRILEIEGQLGELNKREKTRPANMEAVNSLAKINAFVGGAANFSPTAQLLSNSNRLLANIDQKMAVIVGRSGWGWTGSGTKNSSFDMEF